MFSLSQIRPLRQLSSFHFAKHTWTIQKDFLYLPFLDHNTPQRIRLELHSSPRCHVSNHFWDLHCLYMGCSRDSEFVHVEPYWGLSDTQYQSWPFGFFYWELIRRLYIPSRFLFLGLATKLWTGLIWILAWIPKGSWWSSPRSGM